MWQPCDGSKAALALANLRQAGEVLRIAGVFRPVQALRHRETR